MGTGGGCFVVVVVVVGGSGGGGAITITSSIDSINAFIDILQTIYHTKIVLYLE